MQMDDNLHISRHFFVHNCLDSTPNHLCNIVSPNLGSFWPSNATSLQHRLQPPWNMCSWHHPHAVESLNGPHNYNKAHAKAGLRPIGYQLGCLHGSFAWYHAKSYATCLLRMGSWFVQNGDEALLFTTTMPLSKKLSDISRIPTSGRHEHSKYAQQVLASPNIV
jgi:hypothetical protein